MVMRGHPTKGGDDDLDLFRSNANRTTGVILSIVASLIIGWLGIVEPIRTDLSEFVDRSHMAKPEQAMSDIVNQVQDRIGRDNIRIERENVLLYANDSEARAFARADSALTAAQSRYKEVEAV